MREASRYLLQRLRILTESAHLGVSSYAYHLKTCQELFRKHQRLLSPENRKELPPDPFLNLKEVISLEEMNKIALELYYSRSCAHCEHCGRKFRDKEQVHKHQNLCTAEHPLRRAQSQAATHLDNSFQLPTDSRPPRRS